MTTQQTAQGLFGKTIVGIDTSCVNVWEFKFSDGTTASLRSECATAPYSIPFLHLKVPGNLEPQEG